MACMKISSFAAKYFISYGKEYMNEWMNEWMSEYLPKSFVVLDYIPKFKLDLLEYIPKKLKKSDVLEFDGSRDVFSLTS